MRHFLSSSIESNRRKIGSATETNYRGSASTERTERRGGEDGPTSRAGCRDLLNIDEGQAWYLLRNLSDACMLAHQGKGRRRRYILP